MRGRRSVENGGWRTGVWVALAALIALAACAGIIVWRDPAFGAAAGSSGDPATLLVRNLVPVAIVLAFAVGLGGRPLLGAVLTLLGLWALYCVNAIKLGALATPLMPGDALVLGHLGEEGSLLLSRYLPLDAKHLAEAALALVVVGALIRNERAALGRRARVALTVSALALGATLYLGTPPWDAIYDAHSRFGAWTPAAHARRNGLFAHLLRYRWETAGEMPAPDLSAAQSLLAHHRQPAGPPSPLAEAPDIVVLQSESFFDPARLRGLEPAQALPRYRELAAVSRHGNLHVPTYGGGTIRTEFEVLTGIAMRYFPEVQYPYFRLTATPVASLASALGQRGYRTLAIHPHERSFWNRAAALSNLGFSEFDAQEQFRGAPRQGWYTSDDALVERILARLDGSTAPTFVFAISMENHGPYEDYPNVDAARRDAEPVPAGLSDGAARALRGYLYHVENADRALGRLADALRARPRRTLLLFYGDHLPALPDVYAEAGFDEPPRAAHEQPVPWLLFDTAAPGAERIDTAAFYLPALLMSVAGVDDGSYFRLLEAMRRADAVAPGWVPAESDGLGAVMQLRQRGEFGALLAGQL